MLFRYVPRSVPQPVLSLMGAKVRYFPVVPIWMTYAGGTLPFDGLVDSAASDIVFPLRLARRLGVDLTHAPVGESRQAGGGTLRYRYAPVRLRLSDGRETCQWDAVVGFLDAIMPWALLGQAGFPQFFDAMLYGERREVVLAPNAAFSGTYTVH